MGTIKQHDFNQCANDWITCKCGKVFGDNKDGSAKDKFLDHLIDNKRFDLAMYYECQIFGNKRNSQNKADTK